LGAAAVQVLGAPWLLGAALLASAVALWLSAAAAPWVGGLLVAVAARILWVAQGQNPAAHALQQAMDEVVAGNLALTIPEPADEQLQPWARRVEAMQKNWSRLVATIRSEAELAADVGSRLAQDARALSTRTDEQAASAAQASQLVNELLQSVQHNAQEADVANGLTRAVQQQAHQGKSTTLEAVGTVQRIEDRSSQMNAIIGVIDGIAFQTNILALNASIEAARAGESGRGFAVVAAEVRMLAGRTAEAASQVRKLIQDTTREVSQGVTQIREVDRLLAAMGDGIVQVADRVQSLAQSTARQSQELSDVASTVETMQRLAADNAHMVDASADAAERLRAQAGALKQGVVSMRLRQGCADEARALCERARDRLVQQGQAAAVRAFHDRAGGFFDRDLFVILLDRQGWFRAFGVDPSKADKPAVLPPGVDVQATVAQTLALADAGGGWMAFRSWHPVTRTPVDKLAYVLPWQDMAVMVSANRSDGG
jgi:methyl-accepting chemotaxis protein